MQLKHIAIILTAIGIAALYLVSTFSKPTAIQIEDLSEYEGKEVIINGVVIDYYETAQGSQIITIKQNNDTAKIFIEDKKEIQIGDTIRAQGSVQKYQGEYEIIINDKKYLTITQKWDEETITLHQLAENPEKYKNLNINITAKIEKTYGDLAHITDENNTYSLPLIIQNTKNQTIQKNTKINIRGQFIFDKQNLRYQIETTYEKITFYEQQ